MSSARRCLLCLPVCLLLCPSFASAEDDAAARFKKWEPQIAKFEAADQRQAPPQEAVLFVGSSSIRLWDLKKWFPELEAINRGFGGSEVADTLHFADRIVIPYRPRVIVLYAGDNDIAHEVTPEQVASDYQQLAKKVRQSLPKTKLVYVAIKPSLKRWTLVEQVRDANNRIRRQCESDPLQVFVDIDAPMIGDDGKPRPELFASDGLHLSDEGTGSWTKLVAPHLK